MIESTAIPVYKEELKTLRQGLIAAAPADILKIFDDGALQQAKDFAHPLKLKVGDVAPHFELPNAAGKLISLKEALIQGAVVLVFYRGNWCPYCNLSLNGYQRLLDEIKSLGANLIAISPQTPDNSLNITEKNALAFEVLSDAGNKIASTYTTVINIPKDSNEAGLKIGVDVAATNVDKTNAVPIPAVFIISKDGIVVFAKSEGGDFRERVEVKDILDTLKAIADETSK